MSLIRENYFRLYCKYVARIAFDGTHEDHIAAYWLAMYRQA